MGKNFAISKAAYSKFASEETVSESGVSGAAKSSSDEEEWSGKGICYDLDNTDECDAVIQEIDKRYAIIRASRIQYIQQRMILKKWRVQSTLHYRDSHCSHICWGLYS